MKRVPNLRDIYKGIRKPGAPPTRVEGDRRQKIRGREDAREIEKHKGGRSHGGSDRED
jgi:hypothetical protein